MNLHSKNSKKCASKSLTDLTDISFERIVTADSSLHIYLGGIIPANNYFDDLNLNFSEKKNKD